MTKTAHVLELNGRRYDAMTGRLLEDVHVSHQSARSLDGFVPAKQAPHHRVAPAAAHHTRTSIANRTAQERPTPPRAAAVPVRAMDVRRPTIHHAQPHQLQHSKTLMRHVVRRPDAPLKRHARPAVHTGNLVPALNFDVVPKYSVNTVDRDRLKRAKSIARSRFISRFAVSKSVASRPANIQSTTVQPTPQPFASILAAQHVNQPSTDVFERALAAANSHKEPRVPVKHRAKKSHRLRRITSVAASTLAIFLIAGFVAYQNAASIQLQLASSRAGIAATMPTWRPAGFSLGTFAYTPGSVTISYKGTTDPSKHFVITQTASSWNSQTLLSDYVYPNNETYDTVTSNGSTIYMYGNNNATWVNGGLWYKLTSDGSLSTSEIVNIATSM